MRILMATDAFPPRCGGSGWSTWELARALRARGHAITIVQPRPGRARDSQRDYDGFQVHEVASPDPRVPFVRNYAKNERLWARLGDRLGEMVASGSIDVVHGQHVLTGPAAVRAGRATGRAAVCTVRDYWPVCYWGTLIHDPRAASLCPACTAGMMTRCVRPRAGWAWPAALPAIPYMRANLARKQAVLGEADAIVAVSRAIARDVRDRATGLAASRIEVIPNPVHLDDLDAAAAATRPPLPGDYAVFVGKLEVNKGVHHLMPAMKRAGIWWPLMVVGDGSQREPLERQARALGIDARFTGWLDRTQALACVAHASLLVFPSFGPESLSRVLLEAASLRVPIAAMDTGGTSDIVKHEQTGLLAATPLELSEAVARLATDRAAARILAGEARALMERTFSSDRVAARMEQLYTDLAGGKGTTRD
jgi:glycosyltransferase involved in cell wall biosynthesis